MIQSPYTRLSRSYDHLYHSENMCKYLGRYLHFFSPADANTSYEE